ncbi:hypothetical protein ACFRMN_12995 [Streptomyces sp. NPDC056835]|uniref:hypothetical protein n=1 Tax=Streptomyces sp. NPDC056835 TaxID=3345956 RepID=UPI0036B17CC0
MSAVLEVVGDLETLIRRGPHLDDPPGHPHGAEAWAKYAGAGDYDQDPHRDYLGHTLLVPSTAPGFRQLEMFVYLADVPEEFGPAHLVSRKHTRDLPAVPDRYLPGTPCT